MRADGELLEWAEVHGNFYGTPARPGRAAAVAAGRDILFDIDYQGTLQLYEKCRADMVTVFILPPSIKELRARLERRAAGQQGRHPDAGCKNARIEMEHWAEYDYVHRQRGSRASVAQRSATILAARPPRSAADPDWQASSRTCRARSIHSEKQIATSELIRRGEPAEQHAQSGAHSADGEADQHQPAERSCRSGSSRCRCRNDARTKNSSRDGRHDGDRPPAPARNGSAIGTTKARAAAMIANPAHQPATPSPSRGRPRPADPRPARRRSARRRQQVLDRHAEGLEALPHHLAPLAEGGAGHRLEIARPATPSSTGLRHQVHHRRGDLGRRREGVAVDIEGDPRLGAPAGEHAEPAEGLVARPGARCARPPRAGTSASGSRRTAATARASASRSAAACAIL